MAGRKTLAITDRQYRILQALWTHGPMTVRELMKRLPRAEHRPYTTVLGMLQHMQKAGYVTHEKEGVTHRYRPLVSQSEVTGTLLRDFIRRFFGGSAEALLTGLVNAEELSPGDLREIESKLAKGSQHASGGTTSKKKPRRSKP